MMEERIVAALLNAVWQSAVLVAFAALVVRLQGRTSAAVRCAIWCAVLAVVAALPFANLLFGRSVDGARVRPALTSTLATAVRPIGISAGAARFVVDDRVEPGRAVSDATTVRPAVRLVLPDFAAVEFAVGGAVSRFGSWLFRLWMAGSALCALRLGYGLLHIAIMRRRLEPLADDLLDRRCCPRRRVAVAAGERVAVPCLIGFLRPTIVIPRPLVDELETDDLRRIVLHEASHAQRYDDWTNLFVQLARAVLFFNPVVHFIAARIGVEREIACDDRVIELSGDRLVYAECLSTMARAVSMHRAYAVPGFFGGRSQIVVRIEQLLDRAHDSSSRPGRKAIAAVAALALLAMLLGRVGIPVVAAPQSASQNLGGAVTEAQPVSEVVRLIPHRGEPATVAQPRRSVARLAIVVRPKPAAAAHTTAASMPRASRVVVARAAAVAATRVALHRARAETNRADVVIARTAVPAVVAGGAAITSAASERTSSDPHSDFIDELAAAGYRGLSVDQLIRLRDHGVSGEYLAQLKAAGYANLPIEDVIRLRDHGVDPSFIGAMKSAGYGSLRIEDLIRLRDHGVDGELARSLTGTARRRLGAEELITLRDHGVDSSYATAWPLSGSSFPSKRS
jgi:beta-lactamase regulating signal transducer with metallopeptidase domain